MSPTELTVVGAIAIAIVTPLWQYLVARNEIRKVIEAKDIQVEIYKDLATQKTIETKECRDFHHEKYGEANAIILKLTEENADLKAKTNLEPVLGQLAEVTSQLKTLAVVITNLVDRMPHT